jgi:hypothetical protein
METDDLQDLLDIKEIDRDLYEAPAFRDRDRRHLFGGQVAAQALRAAILTVAPDRQPHSLHGYFLRSGTAGCSFVRIDGDLHGRNARPAARARLHAGARGSVVAAPRSHRGWRPLVFGAIRQLTQPTGAGRPISSR